MPRVCASNVAPGAGAAGCRAEAPPRARGAPMPAPPCASRRALASASRRRASAASFRRWPNALGSASSSSSCASREATSAASRRSEEATQRTCAEPETKPRPELAPKPGRAFEPPAEAPSPRPPRGASSVSMSSRAGACCRGGGGGGCGSPPTTPLETNATGFFAKAAPCCAAPPAPRRRACRSSLSDSPSAKTPYNCSCKHNASVRAGTGATLQRRSRRASLLWCRRCRFVAA